MSEFFRLKTNWLAIIYFATLSCSETKSPNQYFGDLGEIPFDAKLDNENFKVCHEDITFPFNYGGVGLIYKGEKRELVKTIRDRFTYSEKKGETGFITIRFLINCEGKTGRFRIAEMGIDLKSKKFDANLTNHILDITKSLNGWQAFERNNKTWDYQQYLTFKFEDGVLKEILP